MVMQVINRISLLLISLAFVATTATAGVEQIVADFKPVPAIVVMEMQGEYLIDKDASHGVRSGDIFVALTAGEKIIHPVTKEVLGTLNKVQAQLRVSNIKSGYSYAVPLPGSNKLKPGEAIVRFQGMPATFWDYTGDGESLYTELKAGMPALEWASYKDSQAVKPESPKAIPEAGGLVFLLTDEGLSVKDATFQSIRFYSRKDLSEKGIVISESTSAAPVGLPTAVAYDKKMGTPVPVKNTTTSGGIVQSTDPTDTEGIWYGPHMSGEIVSIEAFDLSGTGEVGIATAFSHKILLGTMTDRTYQGAGLIDIPEKYRILGVDSADLDQDGKVELYISAVETDPTFGTETAASMVAEKSGGQYEIIADDIPFLLNGVELPGVGKSIVAQRLADNAERTYGGAVYRLKRKGNKFEFGEKVDYNTSKLTVHGFSFIKGTQEEKLLALLNINEKLELYDMGGTRLWAGSDVLGGSQSYVVVPDPNTSREKLHYFLKARLNTLDEKTLLVPINEGSSRMFYQREFSKSKIVALRWDGLSLKEVWQTEQQNGYMADFRVADVDNDGKNEIVMGILFSQGGVLKENQKRSALVVYELP